MRILVIVLSFVVFAAGIAINQLSENRKLASQNREEKSNQVNTVENQDVNEDSGAGSDDKVATITSTPTPDLINDYTKEITDFQYPNSEVVSVDESELDLVSDDNTRKIVEWYKEKVTQEGYGIKNYVETVTNGDVLDELTVADHSNSLYVKIERGLEDNNASIKVKIESSVF